jgi:hypothetical protein
VGAAMVAVLVLSGVFGLIGWYFGHWYHHANIGLYAGLFTAGLIYFVMTIDEAIDVILKSIITFVLGVPIIYGLVLLTQIPLLVFDLISFSAHTFFVSSILGALAGTGLVALVTLSKVLDSGAAQPRLNELFLISASLQGPLAFLIAGSFVVPEHEVAAMIAFGTAWGMVFAAAQSFFTVLVDRKSVRDGWFSIILVEFLLAPFLVLAIFQHWLLEVVLPAAIACAVTYGLVYLIASLPRMVGQGSRLY